MAEQWIIRVQGKEYGPADLATLHEWKSEGRVLPSNPARPADVDSAAIGSAKEALWKTAGEIPGLFPAEWPPVQAEVTIQRSEISGEKVPSKAPSRNVLVETFRIYFRGFFQFLGLALLSIVPILCAEFANQIIESASGVDVNVRTVVAWAFGFCMLIVWLVLIPIYVAGIQILTAELASGQRIGFFSVLNGAVKYWPRVAGTGLFVLGVFILLIGLGLVALLLMLIGTTTASISFIVLALALTALQVWLFCQFFINVLFWQQFAVLENSNAFESLHKSNSLARSGHDLRWYQRPLWRGALIVSVWMAVLIAIELIAAWPRITAQWTFIQDAVNQLSTAQDPALVAQKLRENLPKEQPTTSLELYLAVLKRILQPLFGIALVVLYLDSRRKDKS